MLPSRIRSPPVAKKTVSKRRAVQPTPKQSSSKGRVTFAEQYHQQLILIREKLGLYGQPMVGGSRYPIPPHIENAKPAVIRQWQQFYKEWSQAIEIIKTKSRLNARKTKRPWNWQHTTWSIDEQAVRTQLTRINHALQQREGKK